MKKKWKPNRCRERKNKSMIVHSCQLNINALLVRGSEQRTVNENDKQIHFKVSLVLILLGTIHAPHLLTLPVKSVTKNFALKNFCPFKLSARRYD